MNSRFLEWFMVVACVGSIVGFVAGILLLGVRGW